ncbi:hypothetical protein [Clostridium tagluense]|uniref:Uncharacterized protein n=1 Tax=Clostridium tagluense TaxID=360422 RepID=A0A401UQF4_9CLOT|nr:hypothetical protein [Clostridium tagluense]GCD11750.1 hypothetical protein Ctaglu_33730 [Clostridium tagluense]
MSNFNNQLKIFLMGVKELHIDLDVITVYETIITNKSGLKELINEDIDIEYKFTYIDKLEETGGYITGEIQVSNNICKNKFHITLDNYCNNMTIHTLTYIEEYDMQPISDETKEEWSDCLSKYRKEKIENEILKQSKIVENQNLILANLIQSLENIA